MDYHPGKTQDLTRRGFLLSAGIAAAGIMFLPRNLKAAPPAPLLYPPMDLSYFDHPIVPDPAKSELKPAPFNAARKESARL